MSKMRILMFAMAIGSAIVAGLLAKGVIGKKPEQVVVEAPVAKTTEVLVAAKDLLMGDKLALGTLSWKTWPQENVQQSMITKDAQPNALQDYAEARARLAIYQGETVLEKKILMPGKGGFMSSILPKGMRAISVAISARSSAGGFILPDDRVDVILTRKPGQGGNTQTVKSETVVSNVRVLAVNQVFRQANAGDSVTVEKGETATLELDPHQSEVIAMVESSGELSLALRSIAENDGKKIDDIMPQLAEKYNAATNGKRVNNDTLYVRYGVESYASVK
ncbi:MAG: Flp pilus assembly protein CpaB [Alphaproteobacteria bacterium]|nr:Flp pilus assembly protein CpaB [Alphaproteobacteria bacterium]